MELQTIFLAWLARLTDLLFWWIVPPRYTLKPDSKSGARAAGLLEKYYAFQPEQRLFLISVQLESGSAEEVLTLNHTRQILTQLVRGHPSLSSTIAQFSSSIRSLWRLLWRLMLSSPTRSEV